MRSGEKNTSSGGGDDREYPSTRSGEKNTSSGGGNGSGKFKGSYCERSHEEDD